MRRLTILMFSLLLGGVLIACGGTDDSAPPAASEVSNTTAPTTTATPPPDIVISNFTFLVRGPVKPGQQVTIVNQDDPSHSVATDTGDTFDVRVSGGGGTTTFTAPTAPGSYAFHCKYHADMHGTLTVE